MTIINGRLIADDIVKRLKSQSAPDKILAAILVGNDQASINFLKQKEKLAKELKIDYRLYKFPEDFSNDDLRKKVVEISSLKRVGGVVIQLPLPSHLNRQYILNAIPREKDVDVLSERSLGAFYADRNIVLPPAVGAVEEILSSINYRLSGIKVAIVGPGFLVGKPVANWLMGKVADIYLLDQGSDFSLIKTADLVISGIGRAGFIKPDVLKKDAGIIDFGTSYVDGKFRGDLNDSSSLSSLGFYTPTPGGTGPIVVAKLFENFYVLNKTK